MMGVGVLFLSGMVCLAIAVHGEWKSGYPQEWMMWMKLGGIGAIAMAMCKSATEVLR